MPAFGIFSSIFLEKAFFNRNLGKISLLGNFCSNLSILVNISVSNHSIQGYLAVKRECSCGKVCLVYRTIDMSVYSKKDWGICEKVY